MARKILLADDSVTAQNMGRKILADAGYEVITVNNGSAALKKIAELKPDLIVLDVYMPGYSGLEVCQRVKESPDTSRTPVLLTVGKLEPFKPEEAKRVRAEGFIVKPFEASELLSALSKLEDKIVPRGEASKSGRFARAIAAVEENSRYDKNAGADEDSGWKSRIAFPVKKQKSEEPDGNGPEIYNAMNKDLRTVVDLQPQELKEEVALTQEDRVDLSALAPEGLPKDVSPEEIAALAAAAAQVKSKSAGLVESAGVVSVAASAEPLPYTGPERRAEKIAEREAKRENIAPKNVPAETPVETASVQSVAEKVEATVQKTVEEPKAAIVPSPSADDVLAAIASLERAHESEPVAQNSGLQIASEDHGDVPVTMAAATGAASNGGSRWMAIPVAVAAEETATSLEHEMQKAFAAFAAAENAHAESVVSVTQVSAAMEARSDTTAAAPVPQVETESTQTLAAPSAAPDATHAVVKEFETVGAAHAPAAPAQVEAAAVVSESAPQAAGAVPETAETRAEESSVIRPETLELETAIAQSGIEERKDSEPAAVAQEGSAQVEKVSETSGSEVAAQLPAHESQAHESSTNESLTNETSVQVTAATGPSVNESLAEESSAKLAGIVEELHEPILGGEMAKKESDMAATTAAAWANWRQIRETGDPRAKTPEGAKVSQPKVEEESEEPRDAAAMAVAAGAENRPTEAAEEAGGDPDAIASIVDSVLAQMRPKIVEEISKKLAKKK